ncbi:MAG: hypothetical protein AB7P21_07090 [Lautropia sp.]
MERPLRRYKAERASTAFADSVLERIALAEHFSTDATASVRAEIPGPDVDAFDQAVGDFIAGERVAIQVVDAASDRIGDGRELERCLDFACAATPAWRAGFARALQKALEAASR